MQSRLPLLVVLFVLAAALALGVSAAADVPALAVVGVVFLVAGLVAREGGRWRGDRRGWTTVMLVVAAVVAARFVYELLFG